MDDEPNPDLISIPRDWAAAILEMLRMCWAKSEGPGLEIQEEIARELFRRYPGLFDEHPEFRVRLSFAEPARLRICRWKTTS